jgi:hypothetical protein
MKIPCIFPVSREFGTWRRRSPGPRDGPVLPLPFAGLDRWSASLFVTVAALFASSREDRLCRTGDVVRYPAALDHLADGIGPFGLNRAAPGCPGSRNGRWSRWVRCVTRFQAEQSLGPKSSTGLEAAPSGGHSQFSQPTAATLLYCASGLTRRASSQAMNRTGRDPFTNSSIRSPAVRCPERPPTLRR